MRDELIEGLEALADRDHQQRTWGRDAPQPTEWDNFDEVVHLLYDDMNVLPDPSDAVGVLLFEEDVDALERLEGVLGPLIDELGDVGDEVYLADPRWSDVVSAAGVALETLRGPASK
jgi:hypothetical protein